MRIPSSPTIRIAAGLVLAALLSLVGYQVFRRRSSQAPEALLKRADDLSWLNAWVQAEPLYRQAELNFRAEGNLPRALYAGVSQVPAESESSTTIPSQIAGLRRDLDLPEARDPETRLRILTILGMLETNYDAGMARDTWGEVEKLALHRHQYLLASRAIAATDNSITQLAISTAWRRRAQADVPGNRAQPPRTVDERIGDEAPLEIRRGSQTPRRYPRMLLIPSTFRRSEKRHCLIHPKLLREVTLA